MKIIRKNFINYFYKQNQIKKAKPKRDEYRKYLLTHHSEINYSYVHYGWQNFHNNGYLPFMWAIKTIFHFKKINKWVQ